MKYYISFFLILHFGFNFCQNVYDLPFHGVYYSNNEDNKNYYFAIQFNEIKKKYSIILGNLDSCTNSDILISQGQFFKRFDTLFLKDDNDSFIYIIKINKNKLVSFNEHTIENSEFIFNWYSFYFINKHLNVLDSFDNINKDIINNLYTQYFTDSIVDSIIINTYSFKFLNGPQFLNTKEFTKAFIFFPNNSIFIDINFAQNTHCKTNKKLTKSIEGAYYDKKYCFLYIEKDSSFKYEYNNYLLYSGKWKLKDNNLQLIDSNTQQSFYLYRSRHSFLNNKTLPGSKVFYLKK